MSKSTLSTAWNSRDKYYSYQSILFLSVTFEFFSNLWQSVGQRVCRGFFSYLAVDLAELVERNKWFLLEDIEFLYSMEL